MLFLGTIQKPYDSRIGQMSVVPIPDSYNIRIVPVLEMSPIQIPVDTNPNGHEVIHGNPVIQVFKVLRPLPNR